MPAASILFLTTDSALSIKRKICCCLLVTQMHLQNPGNPYLNTEFPLIDQSVAHTVQEHDTGTAELTAGFNFDPKRFSVSDCVCECVCVLI